MVLGVMVMSSCIRRPPPTDYLPELLESLDLVRIHATMSRIDAFDLEDETDCEGWSIVERVAPLISAVVVSNTEVLPEVKLDLDVCAGSDEHPSTAEVLRVVQTGLLGPTNLATAWKPTDEAGCIQRQVVLAGQNYAEGVAVGLTEHGTNDGVWQIWTRRIDVDVEPCLGLKR